MAASSVEQGQRGAVDDSLRPNVAEGARRHLTVLRHTQGVHAVVIARRTVVPDDHAVRDDHARSVGMRRENSMRMARVETQRLILGQNGQVVHDQAILHPIGEDRPVPTVRNQLLGKLATCMNEKDSSEGEKRFRSYLRHGPAEIVHNHVLHHGGLPADGRIRGERIGANLIVRPKSVAVDVAIRVELVEQFGAHGVVPRLGQIAERVADGLQPLFCLREKKIRKGGTGNPRMRDAAAAARFKTFVPSESRCGGGARAECRTTAVSPRAGTRWQTDAPTKKRDWDETCVLDAPSRTDRKIGSGRTNHDDLRFSPRDPSL